MLGVLRLKKHEEESAFMEASQQPPAEPVGSTALFCTVTYDAAARILEIKSFDVPVSVHRDRMQVDQRLEKGEHPGKLLIDPAGPAC